jgi:hypothetical protein
MSSRFDRHAASIVNALINHHARKGPGRTLRSMVFGELFGTAVA